MKSLNSKIVSISDKVTSVNMGLKFLPLTDVSINSGLFSFRFSTVGEDKLNINNCEERMSIKKHLKKYLFALF